MKQYRKIASNVAYVAVPILLLWLSLASVRIYIYTKNSERLIGQIEPYQQEGANNASAILFIGDSFGYGTGASKNTGTLAGLMGSYLPESRIVNKAQNGTKSSDLAQRIVTDIDNHYRIIVVVIGANDIIHPEVNLSSVRNNYKSIYKTASMKASNVIAITSSDFKDVSFFSWPLNYYFGERSSVLNQLAKAEASSFSNITYIDAFDSKIYPENPKIFESEDRLHPNELGTYYWFQKILERTNKLSF